MAQRNANEACLVVANHRQWALEPRLGRLHVYVDGRPRAVVGLNGERVLRVSSGTHTVRVRHWWFMSPPRTITLHPRAEVHLEADGFEDGSFIRWIARAVFRPLHSVSLKSDWE